MAVRIHYLAAGAMALAVAGCTSLKQSSLVYSSQNNIGVVVRGGSAQAGNFDLTLGYSGHDFAIVPVAVAQPCPEAATEEECKQTKYRLIKIEGVNDVDAAAQALAALASQLHEQSRITLLQRPALENSLAEVDRNLRTISTLPAIRDQIDAKEKEIAKETAATSADPDPLSPASLAFQQAKQARLLQLQQDLVGLQASQSAADELRAANTSEIRNAIDAKIKALDFAVAENERKLQTIINRAPNSTTDRKLDALSVYGEFGGATKAEGTKASLQVGKVFSTGVAAQHLTQQMGETMTAEARAKCFNAAVATILSDDRLKAATKDELLPLYADAMALCQTSPAKTFPASGT